MNKKEITSKVKFRLLEKYTAKHLLPSEEIINDCIENTLIAINYNRCSTQLKDKEAMSFDDWIKSEGYEEKFTGFWKDGKSQDYWTMKDRYNVYRNNL